MTMATMAELVSVDLTELDDLTRRTGDRRRVQRILGDEVTRGLGTIGIMLIREAQANLVRQQAVDLGQLLDGFTQRLTTGRHGEYALEVENAEPHAAATEFGRAAGSKMPPREPIVSWMERVGIPETLEFVVRRAIARNGIAARPFLTPTIDQLRREIQVTMDEAAERAVRRVLT